MATLGHTRGHTRGHTHGGQAAPRHDQRDLYPLSFHPACAPRLRAVGVPVVVDLACLLGPRWVWDLAVALRAHAVYQSPRDADGPAGAGAGGEGTLARLLAAVARHGAATLEAAYALGGDEAWRDLGVMEP